MKLMAELLAVGVAIGIAAQRATHGNPFEATVVLLTAILVHRAIWRYRG